MKLFRIAQAAAVLASLAGAQGALASDGTITFKGAVLTNSCEVDSNGHVPYARSLAPDFTVGLPSVGANMLTAPGQTAGWSPFAITLQHCSGSATLVRAHFEPGTFVEIGRAHV